MGKVGAQSLYLGRKYIAFNNITFALIGKIKNGLFHYYVPGDKYEKTTDKNFEVLACSACKNGGSGPCKILFNIK